MRSCLSRRAGGKSGDIEVRGRCHCGTPAGGHVAPPALATRVLTWPWMFSLRTAANSPLTVIINPLFCPPRGREAAGDFSTLYFRLLQLCLRRSALCVMHSTTVMSQALGGARVNSPTNLPAFDPSNDLQELRPDVP